MVCWNTFVVPSCCTALCPFTFWTQLW